jgi:hypothetical protein
MKDSSPGPILDNTPAGPRPATTPIDQRYRDLKTPIANPQVSPVAEVDPYKFAGKTGQKL